ncbi:MAG: hypothetical protein ACYC6Y_28015 [Thermoguttaceae bacterium]
MERRTFFKTTIVASVPIAVCGIIDSLNSLVAGAEKQKDDQPAGSGETIIGEMIYRPLGRTGERVSVLGLGGHHIARQKDPRESHRLIRAAVDGGITFMDNCWDYHDDDREVRIGKGLRDGYREKVFLMDVLRQDLDLVRNFKPLTLELPSYGSLHSPRARATSGSPRFWVPPSIAGARRPCKHPCAQHLAGRIGNNTRRRPAPQAALCAPGLPGDLCARPVRARIAITAHRLVRRRFVQGCLISRVPLLGCLPRSGFASSTNLY